MAFIYFPKLFCGTAPGYSAKFTVIYQNAVDPYTPTLWLTDAEIRLAVLSVVEHASELVSSVSICLAIGDKFEHSFSRYKFQSNHVNVIS